MKTILRIIPWLFVALFGAEVIAVIIPKGDHDTHTRDFGRLPVLLNGRIQPMDSVGRNALLQIRSTGDLPLELVPSWKFWHHPKKLRSSEWLMEAMMKPEQADTRAIFLIHHPDLLSELNLQDEGIERSGLRYYTFNEIRPHLPEISRQAKIADDVKAEQRTPFQKQVLKLANAVFLYQEIKNTVRPEEAQNFAEVIAAFKQDIGPAKRAAQASADSQQFDEEAISRVAHPLEEFDRMARLGLALVIPPIDPEKHRNDWKKMGESLLQSAATGQFHPAVDWFATMTSAYRAGDAGRFNEALSSYSEWLESHLPREVRKGRAEYYYNQVKAFLHATIIYIFAFVLASGSLLTFSVSKNFSESLRRSAFYLVILAGIVHTFGLVFRMVLEGRPPVTNLYSSAIFIGWGCMVLGVILERVYRVGLGCAVSSVAGFITLLIAHNLALGGDTMEMLRAVLDTNFWLATHVVVVTLGYSSMFVAGLLAIAYVLMGLLTPLLTTPLGDARVKLGKALGKMVYGIVCFATLFSFVGTILGGIWADQSWGRFWGWDPKENGALLIVIWNGVILHARWGGLIRERGLMLLAIGGNIVTSFSWFGVNMLGIGLHSYGFMEAAFKWLTFFMASQLVLIGVGSIPLRFWMSFSTEAKEKGRSREKSSASKSPVPAAS